MDFTNDYVSASNLQVRFNKPNVEFKLFFERINQKKLSKIVPKKLSKKNVLFFPLFPAKPHCLFIEKGSGKLAKT
jgi:hypothetical protein